MKKILLVILLLSVTVIYASDWKFLKKSDGVSVYKRPSVSYPIDEVMVVGTVKRPIDSVVSALKDLKNMPKYFPEMKEMRMISKIDENNYYTYSVMKMPWPVTNRESIMKVRLSKKGKQIVITSVAQKSHSAVPVNDDYVRVTKMVQQWILTPEGSGTKAVQIIKMDPAGNIPTSVLNKLMGTLTIDSIRNLRKMAAKY